MPAVPPKPKRNKKRCRLTSQPGLAKLNAKINTLQSEYQSDSGLAEFVQKLNRETIAKIRNRSGAVAHSSLTALFSGLDLDLKDMDWEPCPDAPVPHFDQPVQLPIGQASVSRDRLADEWVQMEDNPPKAPESELINTTVKNFLDLDALVKRAREQMQLELAQRCGWMRVLNMRQPLELSAIYTDVNILEKITGTTRRDLDGLRQGGTAKTFNRFWLGAVREARVDGLEVVRRQKQLIVLGRPGSGKTTFLKRLATLCNQGEFLPDQVPLFVTLKEFAETVNQPELLSFLASAMPTLAEVEVDQLLHQGRGLVLLDGLDEVLEAQHDRVLREIRAFAERYAQNWIVITCRLAAREYVFEQFTDVEVAAFSDKQIQAFAERWFKAKEPTQLDAVGRSTIGKRFWQALKRRQPIKELATTPLLLTLLCLEFEASFKFPQNRAELYERGVKILLRQWDEQRRIRRDEVYKRLSLPRKVSLLGQLAMHTFARGDYFFRASDAQRLIQQYIEQLPNAQTDPEVLGVDSEAVLKSIEAQHGLLIERATDIYSFSHLTFHEYFTSKHLLDLTDLTAQAAAFTQLVTHITETRWREVFLLIVERMDHPDDLLRRMKHYIDDLLVQDEKLQQCLVWAAQKSDSLNAPYKPAAIRAFYHSLARPRAAAPARDPAHALGLALVLDRALARDLVGDRPRDYALDPAHACARALARARALDHALDHALDYTLDCFEPLVLPQALQQLKEQLPDAAVNLEKFRAWWQVNGQTWIEQLRAITIKHRNLDGNWQFSEAQQRLLQQYYEANKLLVDCLKSACSVSPEVREEIEASLLLPIVVLEQEFPKQRLLH